MKFHKPTNIILGLCAAILLFSSGYKIGQHNLTSRSNSAFSFFTNTASQKNVDFSLYWETWDKLSQKYVDQKKIDEKKLFYDSIKGMVASVGDPYTFFLTPEENKSSKDELGGKFEGIGAQLGLKEGKIVVVAPLKDSPAQKIGIKPGDVIIEVDGKSTEKWTIVQAVSKIRGKGGTTVKLGIMRGDKELTFSVVRAEIFVPTVELSYEKNVAILKLSRFGDDTNAQWDKAVDEIAQKAQNGQVKGIVLDMRDNPGGYLQGAVYVANEFLPADKIVVSQEYTDQPKEEYTTDRTGKLQNLPLVTLINEGSASAAEIVAGALKDYGKTTLVGRKSFGKGSVQEAIDLKNGAGLHVTISKWILPKGKWINGVGVKPDIDVENKIPEGNTLERENDSQLEKALQEVVK